MPRDRHCNRIDVLDIKISIGKKLGSLRAEKYFGLVKRFFNGKLRTSQFHKLCVAAIGRENVCLHNHLIKSILQNACLSKTAPSKKSNSEEPVIDKVANGYQRSGVQSLCRDALPPSPRNGRTLGFRDRRSKDRPSPLGPHGKPNAVAECKVLGLKTVEQQSPTELLSLGSKRIEVNSSGGEEVEQTAISPGVHSRSPVTPPLGIPWNGRGNPKLISSLSTPATRINICRGNGVLPDTNSLQKRLEQKLENEGLGISLDCVNLLNNGLDTYLKRLIKPSLEVARSRFENQHLNSVVGSFPRSIRVQSVPYTQASPMCPSVSDLDFRTAMEIDPSVLGLNWPTQLEKISFQDF